MPRSVFLPEHLFPNPLTLTWAQTNGADLMWVPIPFEKSFRMGYTRTFYGTGYYIYHQYVPGAKLSHPIASWDGKTPPAQDVLDLIDRAGSDIAPAPGSAGTRQETGQVDLPATGSVTVWTSNHGPSMLRLIELSVPREQALAFSRARLLVTWDNGAAPSIDAPVALFFGAGTLYNRDNKKYLVKAFPSVVRYTATASSCSVISRCRSSARRASSSPPRSSRLRALSGACATRRFTTLPIR